MADCVEPDAPIETCVVCGKDVHTCQRDEPVDNSYICPKHPEGLALTGGGWVCSEKCWEEYTGETPMTPTAMIGPERLAKGQTWNQLPEVVG